MIDIIVPVYRGLDETRACLESILSAENQQPTRLIVINDCSPEPELTDWLREQAATKAMLLLENAENLGFVATVNRGMALSEDNDVVLLNSDAEVHGNWLDRLHTAAYSAQDIGTVTPFSNNATICSYPAFCQDNVLPPGFDLASLDRLFAKTNPGLTFDIPTAVGFCMYIRRVTLQRVGLFDVERFGKGYGEENDFCCRALAAGYRNILAGDIFVWHKGNVSFGDSHNDRKQLALNTLEKLHPTYTGNVQAHILADPAREARLSVDLARWRSNSLPKLLFISHDRGGGTEQHCRELTDLLDGQALVFKLAPEPGGLTCLSAYNLGEAAKFHFRLPTDYARLLELLRSIGIRRVHFHHTLGLDPIVFELPAALGVGHDFTTHDYYPLCPQITLTDINNRYCGELGREQCQLCLKQRPVPGHTIDSWRARFTSLLQTAGRVIAPTSSVAGRYQRIFGLTNLLTAEHPDALRGWASHIRSPHAANRELRVAILGALSPVKGPDLLEATARDAEQRRLPLRFKLFGYAYRDLQAGEKLEIHGAYEADKLSSLLKAWEPDLIWLPAQWPETYSYTLSHTFALGLPVLVSDLGAPAERISQRPFAWSHNWQASPAEWNDRLLEISRNTPSETAHATTATSSARFYLADYLAPAISAVPGKYPAVDQEMLLQTRWQPFAKGQKMRMRVLATLIDLRSHPALAWLARRIPMSLQRRIKSRLLGQAPE